MSLAPEGSPFPMTRWSMIQRVREQGPEQARATLAELCEIYWRPLYGFARRQGWPAEDAEDLTQGFFARLLGKELFAKADRELGSLRSFLLGAFRRHMSEHQRSAGSLKRGGGRKTISLDAADLASIEREMSTPAAAPEADFDRVWFDSLLERAMSDLEEEYGRRDQAALLEALLPFLAWNRKDSGLAEVAKKLGMSHGAVRVAIVRMRQRLREHIEAQILQTVADEAQAREELAHLRHTLGSVV